MTCCKHGTRADRRSERPLHVGVPRVRWMVAAWLLVPNVWGPLRVVPCWVGLRALCSGYVVDALPWLLRCGRRRRLLLLLMVTQSYQESLVKSKDSLPNTGYSVGGWCHTVSMVQAEVNKMNKVTCSNCDGYGCHVCECECGACLGYPVDRDETCLYFR